MEKELIEKKMKKLCGKLKYDYNDLHFISEAMHCQIIHKVGDGKNRKNYSNDCFAILGDAVLKLVLTEYYFEKRQDKGKITEIKQEIEKNEILFELCTKLGIYDFAYNDEHFSTENVEENRVPHSKHDVYIEAIIGAIFKDKGFEYVKNWTLKFFKRNKKLI